MLGDYNSQWQAEDMNYFFWGQMLAYIWEVFED